MHVEKGMNGICQLASVLSIQVARFNSVNPCVNPVDAIFCIVHNNGIWPVLGSVSKVNEHCPLCSGQGGSLDFG